MKLIAKLIQLDMKDKEYLDKKAAAMGMKCNQLIRIIIKDYIKGGK